jgi:hypothetical protein
MMLIIGSYSMDKWIQIVVKLNIFIPTLWTKAAWGFTLINIVLGIQLDGF